MTSNLPLCRTPLCRLEVESFLCQEQLATAGEENQADEEYPDARHGSTGRYGPNNAGSGGGFEAAGHTVLRHQLAAVSFCLLGPSAKDALLVEREDIFITPAARSAPLILNSGILSQHLVHQDGFTSLGSRGEFWRAHALPNLLLAGAILRGFQIDDFLGFDKGTGSLRQERQADGGSDEVVHFLVPSYSDTQAHNACFSFPASQRNGIFSPPCAYDLCVH